MHELKMAVYDIHMLPLLPSCSQPIPTHQQLSLLNGVVCTHMKPKFFNCQERLKLRNPRSLFGWNSPKKVPLSEPKYHSIDMPFPPSLLANTHLSGRELKCCYRSASSFHKYCDFKGPCVIIGYTEKGLRFGAFNPEGYRSTDDYYDSFEAFLFHWASEESLPEVLPKVGGSGAALFDYARGGPQFGADGLLIGPPLAPVMGGFAGPDTNSGIGDLRWAKSRLGLSYAKRSDGKDSIFGDEKRATLADVQVFCCPKIAQLY